jgi:hypothetical protein
VPPACSRRSRRSPRRGQVLGQGSCSSPGTGWVGLAAPPGAHVAAGDAGWMGTALSGRRRIGVGSDALGVCGRARRRGRPCDAGVCGVGQGAEIGNRQHGGQRHGSDAGGGGPRSGWGGAWTAAISLSLSRVHRHRTPASPPRSRAVWAGRLTLQPPLRRPGASAPVMAGEAPAVRRAP